MKKQANKSVKNNSAVRQKGRRAKRKNKLARAILTVFLLATSACFILVSLNFSVRAVGLKGNVSKLHEQMERESRHSDEIVSQLNKVEDRSYLEGFIRSQFFLSEEGEQIFILPSHNLKENPYDNP